MSNYRRKVLAVAAQLVEAQRNPGLFTVNVAHDSWCDLLNGRGDCNCDPDIEVRPIRESGALS